MSDKIAYPVEVYGYDAIHDANHNTIATAECFSSGDVRTMIRSRARRIAAALNATRHLTVEELEAVAPDVMEVAVRFMVENSEGE